MNAIPVHAATGPGPAGAGPATGRDVRGSDSRAAQARAAFELFFERHHQDLSRLALSLTGDRTEADDVAADALVEAWRAWDRVSAADHPLAYVRRIVVNLAADRVRRAVRDRRGRRLLGPLRAWVHTPDPGPGLDLQAAILLLPPRRRACVVLRHVYDLPFAEVARTLGITEGAAKSQTFDGLAQLRRLLDPADGSSRPAAQEVPE